jgi:hypothetical protein
MMLAMPPVSRVVSELSLLPATVPVSVSVSVPVPVPVPVPVSVPVPVPVPVSDTVDEAVAQPVLPLSEVRCERDGD